MDHRLDSKQRSPVASPLHRDANLLDSWKEIAAYLDRRIRTAQRWEKREGLPVHRHIHSKASSVYAFKHEVDAWRQSRRQPVSDPASKSENSDRATEALQAARLTPARISARSLAWPQHAANEASSLHSLQKRQRIRVFLYIQWREEPDANLPPNHSSPGGGTIH
jgi:hypothetical protein